MTHEEAIKRLQAICAMAEQAGCNRATAWIRVDHGFSPEYSLTSNKYGCFEADTLVELEAKVRSEFKEKQA